MKAAQPTSAATQATHSIRILSFDAIIGDAECRNHTFLEILKSGMKAMGKADATQSKVATPVEQPGAT